MTCSLSFMQWPHEKGVAAVAAAGQHPNGSGVQEAIPMSGSCRTLTGRQGMDILA